MRNQQRFYVYYININLMATDADFIVSVQGGRFGQASGTLIKPTTKLFTKLYSNMNTVLFWDIIQRVVIIP
jgi:hypothetical protein